MKSSTFVKTKAFDTKQRADTLRLARLRWKMSIVDVAEKAGMSKNTVCNAENSDYEPSMMTLVRLAEFYEIPSNQWGTLHPSLSK